MATFAEMKRTMYTATEPHVCTADACPQTGSYYVSAVDGGAVYLMAGPYTTHQAALADVNLALTVANKYDDSGRAWFMGWGTCRALDGYTEPGRLHKYDLFSKYAAHLVEQAEESAAMNAARTIRAARRKRKAL